MRYLPMSVLEISELSLEEEARIWEVVNYPSHTFLDLVTPEHLHQCGFGLALFFFLSGTHSSFLSFISFLPPFSSFFYD